LHVEATKTEEELLADALLLQQHIGDDTSAMDTGTVNVTKPVVSCRDVASTLALLAGLTWLI
jgi:hypothetical protein